MISSSLGVSRRGGRSTIGAAPTCRMRTDVTLGTDQFAVGNARDCADQLVDPSGTIEIAGDVMLSARQHIFVGSESKHDDRAVDQDRAQQRQRGEQSGGRIDDDHGVPQPSQPEQIVTSIGGRDDPPAVAERRRQAIAAEAGRRDDRDAGPRGFIWVRPARRSAGVRRRRAWWRSVHPCHIPALIEPNLHAE